MGCWFISTKSTRETQEAIARLHPSSQLWLRMRSTCSAYRKHKRPPFEVRESRIIAIRCGKSGHVYESKPQLLITGKSLIEPFV
jgi:hypothetical protein